MVERVKMQKNNKKIMKWMSKSISEKCETKLDIHFTKNKKKIRVLLTSALRALVKDI